MMPDTSLLLSERLPNGVLLLRLNRPDKRNALVTPLLLAIAEAVERADRDEAIRAVVITGGDTLFAAGADIDELAASTSSDLIENPRFLAWGTIRRFSKPLIAAVEGWCLGAGAELMMCCDIVVTGDTAKFGQPETNLGVMPGAGGTSLLPRLVGPALALDMVLTGEPIGADRALTAGLVSRVVPAGTATSSAVMLATKLAARAPLAMRSAKASVRGAMEQALSAHLRTERERFVSLLGGAEVGEGVAAFREKRSPVWP